MSTALELRNQAMTWLAREYSIPTTGEGVNFRFTAVPPEGDYTILLVYVERSFTEGVGETVIRHPRNTLVRVKKGEVIVDPDNPQRPVDTTNKYAVSARFANPGDISISILRPTSAPMTKDDALNLAAYLAALADPAGAEFARVLEAVRNT